MSPALFVCPQLPHRAGTVSGLAFTRIMTEEGLKWAKLSSSTDPPQFVSSGPGSGSLWSWVNHLSILNDG